MKKHTVTLTTFIWIDGVLVKKVVAFVNKSARVASGLAMRAVERLHKTTDVLSCVEYWCLEHSFGAKLLWFHARSWYSVEHFETPDTVRSWSDDLGYWYPLQRQR